MKYTLVALTLLLQLSSVTNARAASLVAGALEPTQWLNQFQLLFINAADYYASVQQAMSTYDTTIGRPLATAMITVAQQQAASDIINWANGNFTENSLIIADPEKYIKDQGLAAARSALRDIPVESIYGGTIFESIYQQYRDTDGSTLEEKLASIARSEVPGLIQENLCNDEEITRLALQDVENNDGTYAIDELNARKEELYAYACEGDPNDPDQAQKLSDLNEQNSSIGGWDAFGALITDNAYTKKTLSLNEVKAKVDTEKDQTDKDLHYGTGPASKTDCFEISDNVAEGEEPYCTDEQITTPSKSVDTALSAAANSGLERLTNLTEGGLTSLLTTMAIQKLTKGLRAEFIDESKKVNVSTGGTSVTKPRKPDLLGDPRTKASILSPLIKQLDSFATSLLSLKETDKTYLSDLVTYESAVEASRSCYDSLIDAGTLTPEDPKAIEAYEVFDNRQEKIDRVRATIVPELKKIDDAKKLVDDTRAKLDKASSTTEINEIYGDYTYALDINKYPDNQADAQRRGEYMKNKNDSKADISPPQDAKDTTRTVYFLGKQCQQLGGPYTPPGSS